jgi:hypothetical protein
MLAPINRKRDRGGTPPPDGRYARLDDGRRALDLRRRLSAEGRMEEPAPLEFYSSLGRAKPSRLRDW